MAQTFPYQYSDLFASINGRIHGKIGLLTNPRTLINDVVNEVSNLYLRSSKKKGVLAPNLFNDIYQYAAPSDIDGDSLIGIQPQNMNRSRKNIWDLVTEEEFDIRKQSSDNLVAFSDHSFVRGLLISKHNGSLQELSIAAIQSLTGDSSNGSSWTAFGAATNLRADSYNFIKGSGSIEFDISPTGNTAGIQLTTVNTFDLTQFISAASAFDWGYINTLANVTGVTLRVGNNSSNYYQMVITAPNDGTSFVNGWNLNRFDFNSKTTVGSPVFGSLNYVAIFFNLASGSVTDTGYRFNWLNAKQGNISNLIYYSTNPWQTIGGVAIPRSTADTDYLICDQDEYNLMVEKGVEVLGMAAREYQDSQMAAARYGNPATKQGMAWDYKRNYPTEALMLTSSYHYMDRGQDNSNIFIR